MQFSLATNWDQNLINAVGRFTDLVELFGKLQRDCIYGGRDPRLIPFVTKREVRLHIEHLHKNSKSFNYLLNSTCLGNKEFTRVGKSRITKLLDWLSELKVDRITVALPFLLRFIKKNYPWFRVSISCNAMVDTVRSAQQWEDLGADCITLNRLINRDFKTLESIRKNIKCNLQLVANQMCSYDNIFCLSDVNFSSHLDRPFLDMPPPYCLFNCSWKTFNEPSEFLRITWIRPEDTRYYENIGINSLKLLDRISPTSQLLSVMGAFAKREFKGNLIELLYPKIRSYHIHKHVYIDNSKLNDFIRGFSSRNCRLIACSDCDYCNKIAAKVVKIDKRFFKRLSKTFLNCMERIEGLADTKEKR
jgi:collagenase-like PrtC family protease